MQHLRLILAGWAKKEMPDRPKVMEGLFSSAEVSKLNAVGYNVYYLPNGVSTYESGTTDGSHIDTWEWVFVDMDLKDKVYESKDAFLEAVGAANIPPTKIVDSGNGLHVYWRVSNLDANSYLRLQRRIMRLLRTDEATTSIYQLMRLPGTANTKVRGHFLPCEDLGEYETVYTAEDLSNALPPCTPADELASAEHYNRTFERYAGTAVSEEMPPKFGKMLKQSAEARDLWAGTVDDRSKADYRLGHLMFANSFTRNEAMSVLANSAKALQRAPKHRVSYAENIVDKIWTFEETPAADRSALSSSVKDILMKSKGVVKGTPFRCHPRIDNTEHGFRLGQVLGLVAGSGVGKTAFALNMFRWFTQNNPDYHHFFVPLEQPANEIADRWATMCGQDTSLHDKVHILSNYDDDGNFRHLSLDEIKDYIVEFQTTTGCKVGCIVIDHIGALKKKGKAGENQDLMDICHSMKAFAIQTNTFLVMQSQSSREKAGIGDLELNKDAAYGTVYFESYCDYLVTIWQPLKRCHSEPSCPTVTAFKFCKIRHKKANKDIIKEDVCYWMYFDSETELMRDLTQDEMTSFKYFLPKATNMRKADRKTDIVKYQSVPYREGATDATEANGNRQLTRH